LIQAGVMLRQAGYLFVEMIRGSNALKLIEKESAVQSLFTSDVMQNLMAILPTDRCFPPGSRRWFRLFSSV
jgi:hypothetical protein